MRNHANTDGPILSENLFPVVGVGASAGGLDAFKALLGAIPPNSQIAWILVQHLSPTHVSMLPEILQPITPLPVVEISDQMEVAPGHVYIIPSNKQLLASDGILQLLDRKKGERPHVIDSFFASLAEVHREQAIGVVLSGTGTDGTVGLKTIRDVGGLTIVQDEESAAHYGMPQSAIDSNMVDMVLPPADIPGHIEALVSGMRRPAREVNVEDRSPDAGFKEILAFIRSRKGVDFTQYRQTTIRRRILRRVALAQLNSLQDYYNLLIGDISELEGLFRDILIPVTAFFRDSHTFAWLCEEILPELFSRRGPGEPIRIWIAACSSGEEAYSMAICIYEFLDSRNVLSKVQIFATDLSEELITKARAGIYRKSAMAGVSETRLQQFFTWQDGYYRIQKSIREMCVFAGHNFLKDPPFVRMDLISCRNVLIYMEAALQKKALATFHYSLRPGGYLLLGHSESVGEGSDQFHLRHKDNKIYSRKASPPHYLIGTAEHPPMVQSTREVKPVTQESGILDVARATDKVLLQEHDAVGVVVNQQMDIVQFRGQTGAYLSAPPGNISYQLLRMVREGLAFELRGALQEARHSGQPVHKTGIAIEQGTRRVDVRVLPLADTEEMCYFVGFRETKPIQPSTAEPQESGPVVVNPLLQETLERIAQLERELSQTRADMRSITDEQEAVNEELQSANEELLSGSEELQSINEELQTTREEVQSTNEELTTLNQELVDRNDQLADARRYAEAIITTIHEPLVILTSDLRIRSGNAAFYDTFSLRPEQVEGALFMELSERQWAHSGLEQQLLAVLVHHRAFENVEIEIGAAQTVKTMLLNGRPLMLESNTEQWILLTIRDITLNRRVELHQRSLTTMFRNMILESPAFAATFLGPDHVYDLVNPAYQSFFGSRRLVGRPVMEAVPELQKQGFLDQLKQVYLTGKVFLASDARFLIFPDEGKALSTLYVSYSLQPLYNELHAINGVLAFGYETTRQVLAKQEAEKNLRIIVEATHHISWTALPTGDFDYFNRQFYLYTGLPHNEERNVTWGTLLPADLRHTGIDRWQAALAAGMPFYLEAFLQRADGAWRWHIHRATPVRNEQGVITAWVGTSTDIQDQKIFSQELESQVNIRTLELQQSNTRLRYSNANLEQFASIASHDLQEPLRKIRTFTSILNRRFSRQLSAEGQEVVGKIKKSAERMSQLIQEVLEYSKVIHEPERFVSVNLDDILRNVLGDLELMIGETQATIEYAERLPVIDANALQMNQLFYNLLTNALKFSRETTAPAVTITHERLAHDDARVKDRFPEAERADYLEIVFSDNGIGFSQDYAEQIFQLFERLHSQEEFEGTGIGLALCRQILQHHHGFLYALSAPDDGARFIILLPVEQPDGVGRSGR